jgi:phospholipid/cholesterol/gamma-HCH transport system ATP-binding protein
MIEVRDLKKSFGPQPILDGVSFGIEKGESLVIIGRSGGGKSVLLKHIIGLLKPDAGQVIIDDEDITHMNERELIRVRSKFGMVFQGAALFDSMNVAENVGFAFRREKKFTAKEVAGKVTEALDMVELRDVEHKRPSELSGGMRKRVGLARAIVYHPEIVLYDEPTTGLDPIMADVIDQLIRSLQKRLGVTSIVVTHDMTSAYKVGDRLAMLNEGKIVFTGTPDEARATRDPLVRQFIEGSSEGPIQPV